MIQCKKCLSVIVSRHVHDFRSCDCGSVSIDGGKDYTRIVGDMTNVEMDRAKFVSKFSYDTATIN